MTNHQTAHTAAIESLHDATGVDGAGRAFVPENLASLFVPETLLPAQVYERARRDSRFSPEKALMLAVLEDGIRCFQGHLRNPRANPRLLAHEAEAWIRTVGDPWACSFDNVCEMLEIDPSALRAALLGWKAKRLAERDAHDAPMPAASKVYRLHLRTKRRAVGR